MLIDYVNFKKQTTKPLLGGGVALTACRYLFTFSWSVLSRKLKIFSMFWVNVCWISLLLWGGSVWKVTTSSASRKRINITNSVCVSCINRNKLIKLKPLFPHRYAQKLSVDKINSRTTPPPINWTDIVVFHTPCLERVSSSISISGQCCGHSRLIISTTIRDKTSLIWFSSSKISRVPWKRVRDSKRFARLNLKNLKNPKPLCCESVQNSSAGLLLN